MHWILWRDIHLEQVKLVNCSQILYRVADQNCKAKFHMTLFSSQIIQLNILIIVIRNIKNILTTEIMWRNLLKETKHLNKINDL